MFWFRRGDDAGTIGAWTGCQGWADGDLGNTGSDPAVDAADLDNGWFNIVWTNGAGCPATTTVARTAREDMEDESRNR